MSEKKKCIPDVEKLETENAALKAANAQQAKALRVLAEMAVENQLRCRVGDAARCPDTVDCGEEGCLQVLEAYAMSEAEK